MSMRAHFLMHEIAKLKITLENNVLKILVSVLRYLYSLR